MNISVFRSFKKIKAISCTIAALGCFCFVFLLTSFNAASDSQSLFEQQNNLRIPNLKGIKKIVIDAGHGGEDPGCLGSKAKEKIVALSVSLKLGKLIEDNFKDVEVIYTRKTDVFIELHKRAQIANDAKADLFICVHCNSGPKTAYGTETYVMGLHKTVDNLSVAKRENESILLESNYVGNYDGFDPKSPEANIIFSLYQNAYMDQSLEFASLIQGEVKTNCKRYDRGVKQAGFLVLYKTTMPSVLIETGFLTNENEEKFLNTDEGQTKMATAIYEAFKSYKLKMEGGIQSKITATVSRDSLHPSSQSTSNKSTEEIENVKTTSTNATSNLGHSIVFRVQIASSAVAVPLTSADFKGLKDVKEIKVNTMYKYYVGEYLKAEDAQEMQNKIRAKGLKDAFVVAFDNGKIISVTEAKKLYTNQVN